MEKRLHMLLILFLVWRGTTLHLLQRNKIVLSPIYQTALTRKVWKNVHIGTSSNWSKETIWWFSFFCLISKNSCSYCNFSGCGWRIIFFAQTKTTLHYPVTTGCPMGGKVSDYGTADFIQHVLYVCRGAAVYNAPEAKLKLKLSGYDVCYL